MIGAATSTARTCAVPEAHPFADNGRTPRGQPQQSGDALRVGTGGTMFPTLSLARLPTPLQHLRPTSERLGVDVFIKRDDLTGAGMSGNKVRKLERLLADVRTTGVTTVLTTGGTQSNHCRATAIACRQLGLMPRLLLRGTEPPRDTWDGNLLMCGILGADIRWTAPDCATPRGALLDAWANELRAAGEVPLVIPEGGSNALGSAAFADAAQELRTQLDDQGVCPSAIVVPVGSGGTLAGLAMGGLPAPVLGIAVCDDQATFRARVQHIAAGALPPPGPTTWDVIDGFQGQGYALTTPEELKIQVRFARETGIFLDPVYTGKCWVAIESLVAHNPDVLGSSIVFWHTGGIFGLFGRGHEYAPAIQDR